VPELGSTFVLLELVGCGATAPAAELFAADSAAPVAATVTPAVPVAPGAPDRTLVLSELGAVGAVVTAGLLAIAGAEDGVPPAEGAGAIAAVPLAAAGTATGTIAALEPVAGDVVAIVEGVAIVALPAAEGTAATV
jgi:hypothetical protein